MKSILKICTHYVLIACLLIPFLIIVNLIVMFTVLYRSAGGQLEEVRIRGIEKIVQSLKAAEGGSYKMTDEGYGILRDLGGSFAMLIDAGGAVTWEWEKPEEVPDKFSPGDIAAFSRWYLKDYPVACWRYGDEELFVIGYPKGNIVRYNMYMSMTRMNSLLRYAVIFCAANLLLIFGLALFAGYRFYRTLKPVGEGIDALANGNTASLNEKGTAQHLKAKINEASRLLENQREALARRDAARTEWIAGVSHDIRTPLSVIVGNADAIETDPALPASVQRRAGTIREQSFRIKKLIEDLNLTSKLEYHMQPIRPETCYPAVWLRKTAAAMRNSGELPECCDLELEISPGLEELRLECDVQLLTRALVNLLGNCARHNPCGCRIFLSALPAEGGFCFCVEDDGPGIPETVRNILKNDGDVMKDRGPHVMGLRVVSRIAGAHGGSMWFEKDGRAVWVSIHSIEKKVTVRPKDELLQKRSLK